MANRGYCRVMATLVVVFIFSLNAHSGRKAFPRVIAMRWGRAIRPRREAARYRVDKRRRGLCPSLERDRDQRQRLDHTPVHSAKRGSLGSNIGPRARAGRWPSSTSRFSIRLSRSTAAIGVIPAFPPPPKDTSMEAAIAQAAHDTLSALFPSQAPSFDTSA